MSHPPQAAPPHSAPLGGSLWDDLPAAGSAFPAATSLPPARSLPAATSAATASFGGSGRKFGYEFWGERKTSEVVARMILFFICFGIGSVIAMFAYGDISQGRASKSWPSTPGTILRSEIVEAGMRKGRQQYKAQVEYSYVVNGVTQTSQRVAVSGNGSLLTNDAVIQKYPVGSTHPVYYNPSDSSYAVLENGLTTTNIFGPLFAVIFLLVGVGGLSTCVSSLAYRMT